MPCLYYSKHSNIQTIKTPKLKGHIAILFANIFFGINNPVMRSLTPDTLDPFVMTFFRVAGSAAIFWLISLFVKPEKIPLKDIGLLFLAAILCHTTNQYPFIIGLSRTSSIDASIVVTLLPVLSMIFAAIIIKEPITWKKAGGVFIGASGALLLVLNEQNNNGRGSMQGNLIVLVGVLSFSLYLTVFKKLISKYSVFSTMKWMFLFSAIQSEPFCHRALLATDFASFDSSVWLRITYAVVCATFVSYLLLVYAQKILRPTTLAMYNYVQPIMATLVAVIAGIDRLGMTELCSALLVFVGVYFVTQSKSRAQIEAEKEKKSLP
ncbi:MAG: DMT family transporter [Paludibacter sp.]|jgi:drug/metabolite transporter (DMT)-like permease|nr:DMT family transporter [Paludibacter sp.]